MHRRIQHAHEYKTVSLKIQTGNSDIATEPGHSTCLNNSISISFKQNDHALTTSSQGALEQDLRLFIPRDVHGCKEEEKSVLLF